MSSRLHVLDFKRTEKDPYVRPKIARRVTKYFPVDPNCPDDSDVVTVRVTTLNNEILEFHPAPVLVVYTATETNKQHLDNPPATAEATVKAGARARMISANLDFSANPPRRYYLEPMTAAYAFFSKAELVLDGEVVTRCPAQDQGTYGGFYNHLHRASTTPEKRLSYFGIRDIVADSGESDLYKDKTSAVYRISHNMDFGSIADATGKSRSINLSFDGMPFLGPSFCVQVAEAMNIRDPNPAFKAWPPNTDGIFRFFRTRPDCRFVHQSAVLTSAKAEASADHLNRFSDKKMSEEQKIDSTIKITVQKLYIVADVLTIDPATDPRAGDRMMRSRQEYPFHSGLVRLLPMPTGVLAHQVRFPIQSQCRWFWLAFTYATNVYYSDEKGHYSGFQTPFPANVSSLLVKLGGTSIVFEGGLTRIDSADDVTVETYHNYLKRVGCQDPKYPMHWNTSTTASYRFFIPIRVTDYNMTGINEIGVDITFSPKSVAGMMALGVGVYEYKLVRSWEGSRASWEVKEGFH